MLQKEAINEMKEIFIKYDLDYIQTATLCSRARKELGIRRKKRPQNKVVKLTRSEERKLIYEGYLSNVKYGLMLKTLFLTGARISEFISIRAEDVLFNENKILIREDIHKKSRWIPILPELSKELKNYLQKRRHGYLFESNRKNKFINLTLLKILFFFRTIIKQNN